MPFVGVRVTERFCGGRWIEARLQSPFRPSASYLDEAKVAYAFRSGFRPDFVGFLRPVTYVALGVVCAIATKKRFYAR
ncbi:hypothetical protein EWW49_29770 [Pseudomonas syringae]|nr:hypothetical protein EWW49_29770 [Pseudomonas syringae]